MTILFLDQFSDPGGGQLCLLDLLPAAQTRGWRCVVAAPGPGSSNKGSLGERAHQLGVRFRALECGPYASGRKGLGDALRFVAELPRLRRRISDLIAEVRPDLMYVNGPRLLPAVALAAGRDLPTVFHCHHAIEQRAAALAATASLRLGNSTVIACCRHAARPIERAVSPARLHVVFNSSRAISARRRRFDPRMPVIGMLGRIAPEKGQLDFVAAARRIHAQRPECRFLIGGDVLFDEPAAREYAARARESAAGLPLEFVGRVADPAEFFERIDLLAMPSVREPGNPRVLLEAFAASVPVVAYATGGIPEVLSRGRGVLPARRSPGELADSLLEALRDPERMRSFAQNAYAAWEKDFRLERFQGQVLEIVSKAAADPVGL